MALKDTLLRRLEIFISTRKHGATIAITRGSMLGNPPIGYDNNFLKGVFREEINNAPDGFKDLLKTPIAKSEVSSSKSAGDLVDTILAKSLYGTAASYRAKMLERTRIGLQHILAHHATPPVSADTVAMTDFVSKYVNTSDASATAALLKAIEVEFSKYLFSMPSDSVLSKTVGRVQQNLVDRMEM